MCPIIYNLLFPEMCSQLSHEFGIKPKHYLSLAEKLACSGSLKKKMLVFFFPESECN